MFKIRRKNKTEEPNKRVKVCTSITIENTVEVHGIAEVNSHLDPETAEAFARRHKLTTELLHDLYDLLLYRGCISGKDVINYAKQTRERFISPRLASEIATFLILQAEPSGTVTDDCSTKRVRRFF